MNTPRKSEAGFGAVESLIVVAIVVVISAAGLLVYQHHKQAIDKSTTSSSSQNSAKRTTSSTTQTAQQYLVIKEWGVELPLSSAISDAYYVPTIGSNKGSDGQPNQFNLGLKSLDSSGCSATSNTSAPVLLFRVSPTETDAVTGKIVSEEGPGVTIGNYFYGYSLTKNKGCGSDATFQSLGAAMTIAVKSIVATSSN